MWMESCFYDLCGIIICGIKGTSGLAFVLIVILLVLKV